MIPDMTNLSFQSIPTDPHRKKTWLIRIRQDEGPLFTVKPHTKVCSAHFKPEDFARTLTGMKCLTKQACPSLFDWIKNTPARKSPTPRLNPTKRKRLDISNTEQNTSSSVECGELTVTPQPVFHDYLGPEQELSTEEKLVEATQHIHRLEQMVEQLTISRFGLHRFADDPKMLLFYTGFSSYQLLRPTAEKMTRWSQVQRNRTGHSTQINTQLSFRHESIPLVDQFFYFW